MGTIRARANRAPGTVTSHPVVCLSARGGTDQTPPGLGIPPQPAELRYRRGELEVATVIWATGFCSDYWWVHAPALDAQGAPIHRRGVTDAPGLFFLGTKDQYSRGSSLIGWIKHDAAFIVKRVGST